MRRIYTILFVFSFHVILLSQTKITGKVTDQNNSPLPGANIYIKDTYDGTSSSPDGTFSFSTQEKGDAVLIVSFIGYKQAEEKLNLKGAEIHLEIKLEEDSKELGTIVISAGSFEASDENKAVILRPLDIVTTAGASADIYGALETLPGTQQIGEEDGLFVRGGA
ncbi:MAG: carboxypeptidase-like regulatory domain-containing protein, partial [Ignavibacteria bacterium]